MSLKIDYDINPAEDAPKPISAAKRAAMFEGNDMLSGAAERRRMRRQGHGHRRKAAIRPGDDFSKELEKSMTWPPPSLRSPVGAANRSSRDAFTPITDDSTDEEKTGSELRAGALTPPPIGSPPSAASVPTPAAIQRLQREAAVRRRSQPPPGLPCVPETSEFEPARYDALDQFRAKPSSSPPESKSGSPDRTSPSSSGVTTPHKPALSFALDEEEANVDDDPSTTCISEDTSGVRSVVDVWPRVELEYSPTGTSRFNSRAWTAVKARDHIGPLPASFLSEDDAASSSSSSGRSDGSPSPPHECERASCDSSSSTPTPTQARPTSSGSAGHLDPSALGVSFMADSPSLMERNLAEETLVESLPFWHKPVARSGPLRHVRVWALAGTVTALATGYLRVFGLSHVQTVRNWVSPAGATPPSSSSTASSAPIRAAQHQ